METMLLIFRVCFYVGVALTVVALVFGSLFDFINFDALDFDLDGARTEQGVDIRADGVAVIKVKSDKESILNAIEQFNTGKEQQTIDIIKDTAKDVLEGKLREIISKMTVEEIYKDREKFASQVQEVAAVGLASMGLELKAFTIRDISDKNGYLEALGKPRIAEVKKNAAIAEAVAAPLAKTEKIVIIDNGSAADRNKGAAKVAGYVADIVSQLPETIEAMTGLNIMETLKDKLSTKQAKDIKEKSIEK